MSPARPHNLTLQSIFWILTAKLSFVLMMMVSRLLKEYSPLQLNFMRSFLVLLGIAPYLITTKGWAAFKTKQPLIQGARVLLSSTSMLCFFYGYHLLPMSRASAINFAYALIVPLFAALFLKERLSIKRWFFLILGYVGILIIINPIFEELSQGEIVCVLGVVCFSLSSILVKKLTRTDESSLVVFYSSVTTSVLLGIYFLISATSLLNRSLILWRPPCWDDLSLLFLMGIFSFLGQFGYVHAYRKGRLSFLAGFDYIKFLFASFLGFLFFGENLEPNTFYGALIILIGSYYAAREEIKKTHENY